MTIIEVLVAIALLSVILLAVITPLTGFFGLTQRSQQQVGATQAAQRAVESLRADWLNDVRYSRACTSQSALFAGLSTEITNLDPLGNVTGGSLLTDCATASPTDPVPALRRVKVSQFGPQGEALSTLTVEIDKGAGQGGAVGQGGVAQGGAGQTGQASP